MSMKVDQASAVEPPRGMTGTSTSSAALPSSQKISMLKGKSGFVIPKNKLSGSLVPIFRGGKKQGDSDAANEESAKQVQRKTKWGPDLTQDATVRRGRALAYQTRVDQITEQLKSRSLDIGDSEGTRLEAQDADQESLNPQINSEKLEVLELERREAIGEILKLNPSYKAPPDYEPLLKEANVPIPVKEYPGYNFLGLIFGPGSDTQKRLEKETGAKVRVYGTKLDTKEKTELSSSDEKNNQRAYDELYILVSADTYEKVDAAVALIELLVNPVSGKIAAVSTTPTSVAGDDVNVLSQSQDTPSPHPIAVLTQGVVQPFSGPAQTPLQSPFQYSGPWFGTGPTHTLIHPPYGFIPSPNSSAPILNNAPLRSPFNPSNMPSLFGPRPSPAFRFGSILQNPFLTPPRPQQSIQVSQQPITPQERPFAQSNFPGMSAPQTFSAQANISAPHSFTGGQPMTRSLMPSLPQPILNLPPGPPPNRPMNPVGNSAGWSGSPVGPPASLGSSSSMVQMTPPFVPPQRPSPLVTQPNVASMGPPPNSSTTSMLSPVSFPPRPSTPHLSSTVNHPIPGSVFSSILPPRVGPSPVSSASLVTPGPIAPVPAQASIQPFANVPMHPTRAPVLHPSPNPVLGSGSNLSSVPSASPPTSLRSGMASSASMSVPNFTPMKAPSVGAPKSQPNPGDFTFQPHRVQNPTSPMAPWPSSQPAAQNPLPPRPATLPPLAAQAAPFSVGMHNSSPQPAMQVFPRPRVSNLMGPPQDHFSAVPFGINPNAISTSPRLTAFPNASPAAPLTSVPQMGPRTSSPANQMLDMAVPLSSRPGHPMLPRPNYAALVARPLNLLTPNQFSNNPSFASDKPAPSSSGGQQIYDPFSPSSVSQQQSGSLAKVRKQENDPEYDDLMASVGVK